MGASSSSQSADISGFGGVVSVATADSSGSSATWASSASVHLAPYHCDTSATLNDFGAFRLGTQ